MLNGACAGPGRRLTSEVTCFFLFQWCLASSYPGSAHARFHFSHSGVCMTSSYPSSAHARFLFSHSGVCTTSSYPGSAHARFHFSHSGVCTTSSYPGSAHARFHFFCSGVCMTSSYPGSAHARFHFSHSGVCTTSSYPAPHTPNSTFLILACARPPLTRLRTRQIPLFSFWRVHDLLLPGSAHAQTKKQPAWQRPLPDRLLFPAILHLLSYSTTSGNVLNASITASTDNLSTRK